MSVRLDAPRLVLREPEERDAPALLLYHQFNEERFARWEPEVGDLAYYLRWVAWRQAESAMDRGRSFLALDRSDPDALAGIVSLYDVYAGSAHSAVLGYSVGGAHEGKGYAREMCEAVIAYAFGTLNLHRIMANYHPANERSGALLRRLGFVVEGYARDMLYLRGTWRDHVMTSLTNPAWRPPNATAPG